MRESRSLAGKTLLITGASRGIGLAIALRAAADGANVAVIGKTETPHPRLPGTIHTAAQEIEAAGGKALPLAVDVRSAEQIAAAIEHTVKRFGGIDILVNNASAISLTGTLETPIKRFDLMVSVNVRATFLCTQLCLPHLKRAANPHVLTMAPPINLSKRWFASHLAYTIAKYGMSMCVIGMSEEFRDLGIAVNGLWPKTLIATAALQAIPEVRAEGARKPAIVASAAWEILTSDSRLITGNFFVDEDVLEETGIRDFSVYAASPGSPLATDLFLD